MFNENFHFPGDFYFSSKFQETEIEFQEISRRFFHLKIPGDRNGIPGGGHPGLAFLNQVFLLSNLSYMSLSWEKARVLAFYEYYIDMILWKMRFNRYTKTGFTWKPKLLITQKIIISDKFSLMKNVLESFFIQEFVYMFFRKERLISDVRKIGNCRET